MKLLVATTNPGKIKEFQTLLKDLEVEIISATDLDSVAGLDVEETGQTYQDNALLKAKTFAEKSGLLTVADDSGLEVTALDNGPGVHSNRFFQGSDQDRNQKIISLLTDKKDRTAQFVAVLCLYDPETEKHQFFEGRWHGSISDQEKGEAGFAYDRIFIPEGYDRTTAELGMKIKNEIGHRALALQKLKSYLSSKKY